MFNTRGERAGPQRRMKQVDKLLIGMNAMRTNELARGVLTSDLHGGCGPKLTDGFYTNTIGRPGFNCRPPATAILKTNDA